MSKKKTKYQHIYIDFLDNGFTVRRKGEYREYGERAIDQQAICKDLGEVLTLIAQAVGHNSQIEAEEVAALKEVKNDE